MVKKNGPWTIHERSVVYTNHWIQVHEDKVSLSDGTPGIFGIVTIKPGISVLAIDDHDFVYLTREFHYAIKKENLEVVSGGIEKNETPLHAAQRELEEELGITAQEWVDLGIINPFTTVVDSPAHLFIAKKLIFGKNNLDSTEHILPVKVTFDNALEMVMKGTITHGPSCVLILKANEFINKSNKKL